MSDEVVTWEEKRAALLGAVDILEEYGWIRGHYGNQIEGFCLVGALGVTIFGFDGRNSGVDLHKSDIYEQVATALEQHIRSYSLITFNDKIVKSKEDVIRALKDTAANVV